MKIRVARIKARLTDKGWYAEAFNEDGDSVTDSEKWLEWYADLDVYGAGDGPLVYAALAAAYPMANISVEEDV
jgi:hypothetical protein